MKKIGFIEHYMDSYHAGSFPGLIRESRFSGEYEVSLAWAETDPPGKKSLSQWCADMGIGEAASIEQVVEESDCLVVLAPNNPERHEFLSDLPLRSGKPVYVDKTLAPDLPASRMLFEKAERFGTPLMSCSALRFGSALEALVRAHEKEWAACCSTRGGGKFPLYAVHQLEMLVMVMGTGARRVIQCGTETCENMVVEYPDGRRGSITVVDGHPFQISARYGSSGTSVIDAIEDFFPRFIDAMLGFFETGISPVPVEQTLEICAILQAGLESLNCRDSWIDVPG